MVDQAILVAVKLDADLSMWLRDYATAGADEGFPEITYLRHVTPHSRARVPSAGRRLRFRRVWMKTGLELI